MASADAEQRQPDADEEESSKEESSRSTRMTAGEIYDNVRVAAQEELRRPAKALLWSAIAAGLTIGFSFFAGGFLTTLVPDAWKGAANAAGYPLGFVFVVLARGQLFTENTLEPILPLLHRPTMKTAKALVSLWAVVLVGNLIGGFIFAAIAALTPMLDEPVRKAFLQVAQNGTSGGFLLVGLRAIYAGWLIALMAWLIASTRATGAQVLLIWLTTAPIAALGFRHSIAGSVEAFYCGLLGATSWADVLGNFVVPALVGNVIGGVVFVALLNHGQVAADRDLNGQDQAEEG